jgi:hypothetical protein
MSQFLQDIWRNRFLHTCTPTQYDSTTDKHVSRVAKARDERASNSKTSTGKKRRSATKSITTV